MKSGGTRQAVLVAAALAASAVLAAWWWSSSAHPSSELTALAKTSRIEVVGRRASGEPAAMSVAKAASTPAMAPMAANEAKSAPSSAADSEREIPSSATDPNAEEKASSDTNTSVPATEMETASGESGAKSPLSTNQETTSEVAKPEDGESNGQVTPTDDESSADATAGSSIDADKAAEQMARYLADLDTSVQAGSEYALFQHDFDSRDGGGDVERRVEEALRKGISGWIATLPAGEAARLMLMSVECRVGQCRILMVEAHDGVEQIGEVLERQEKLIAAFVALSAEPWWQALGFDLKGSTIHPASDGSGIGLWIQYGNIRDVSASSAGGG